MLKKLMKETIKLFNIQFILRTYFNYNKVIKVINFIELILSKYN